MYLLFHDQGLFDGFYIDMCTFIVKMCSVLIPIIQYCDSHKLDSWDGWYGDHKQKIHEVRMRMMEEQDIQWNVECQHGCCSACVSPLS